MSFKDVVDAASRFVVFRGLIPTSLTGSAGLLVVYAGTKNTNVLALSADSYQNLSAFHR